MGFNNKIRFLRWLLATTMTLFAIIVIPLMIYHQFVLKIQNQKWNQNHCENELTKTSDQIRTYLTEQVDGAKKSIDTGLPTQNSLSFMTYEYHNEKWNLKTVTLHPELSKLYKIKVSDLAEAYQNHPLLHPVSQEIKLERRNIKNYEMIGIYFIHRNPTPMLVLIHTFPEYLQKTLRTDPTCNLALIDNSGNTVASYISDAIIKSFLFEYQSYSQNPTKTVQSLKAATSGQEFAFLYNSVLKNVLLLSTVSQNIHPLFAQYLDLFNYNGFLILIFIVSMCWLVTQFAAEKMSIFKGAMNEMANGIFKSHPTQSEDPVSSELFEELAKFSNHFLYRLRSISKFQKLQKLKNIDLKHHLQTQETVSEKAIILHLELKNQEAVSYDYKIMHDVAELSSLWSNIGEMIEDSGGVIDTLTGGAIRGLWFVKAFEAPGMDRVVKLALEIQDLVNSINKHRFLNNSSPYKIHIGLHRGEIIMASLGPLERKEFTPLGGDLETTISICAVAKETLSPIVLSQSVYEFVNKNYFFAVLDQVVNNEKLYNIHTQGEPQQKNKKERSG